MKCSVNANPGSLLHPIFCDNQILILKKPANIATQPEFHLQAKEWVKEKFSKPGNVFLEPIHRLDKPVSGLVLFARTSKALSRLNEAMRNRTIRKFYRAEVEGILPQDEGTLEHFLMHGEFRAHVVEEGHPEGKKATLHYKIIRKNKNSTEIEIELHTGRYHQIRAQFAAIGHPVLGDNKYGSTHSGALVLQHHKLILEHPTTKETMSFSL